MKKTLLFSLTLLLLTVIILTVVFSLFSDNYIISVPSPNDRFDVVSVRYDETVIENVAAFDIDGFTYFVMEAVSPGNSSVVIRFETGDNSIPGFEYRFKALTVNSVGMLYRESLAKSFQYWQLIFIGVGLYFLGLSIWFYRRFSEYRQTNLFDYSAVINLALMVLCLSFALILLTYGVLLLTRFYDQTASAALSLLGIFIVISTGFSLPLVLVFFLAVGISNIALIKHEGFRPINLLGSFVGLMISAAIIVCVLINAKNYYLSDSDIIMRTVSNIVSLAILFLEAIIISVAVCALICLHDAPDPDCDFLMILGCGIRKDGTPSPLLKGRIDAAIAFYNSIRDADLPIPYIIPSGGKGNDEIVSEAESMRRYLISHGIPESQIIPETNSTTTLENMRFSKIIIDREKEDAKVVFSTTGYHVFRSGIYASQVGLKAKGIGSKTRWYFWPNAFMREVIGLLAAFWRKELVIGLSASVIVLLIVNIQNILIAVS